MAVLYISEYVTQPWDGVANTIPAGLEPALVTQTVAIGAEAKSAAFNARTRFVRVHTDAICSVLFGANPTATTSSPRMAANQTEFFGVDPSQVSGLKLSVIANT